MQQQIAQQQQLEYQQNLQQQMRIQQPSTPGIGSQPSGYFMHPQSPMITNDVKPQQVGTPVGFSNETNPQQSGGGFMTPTPINAITNSHCDNSMLYSQQQQRNLNGGQQSGSSGGGQQSQMFANLTDFADDNVDDLISSIPEDGSFFLFLIN